METPRALSHLHSLWRNSAARQSHRGVGIALKRLRRIDAHLHLWQYDAAEYGWIDDSMRPLRRDFLPEDLAVVMDSAGVDMSVAVQARQSEEETRFLLACAEREPRICGVVGWAPLTEPAALVRALDEFCRDSHFVGLRDILQGQRKGFLLRPEFLRGMERLGEYSLTYDILIFSDQLEEATQLVDAFPQQQFILDHCAKPHIAAGEVEPWARDLKELARRPNVVCKLSGMVTEATWSQWTPTDLVPYLDTCTEAFGPARLMAGSDWPVCLLATGYAQWWKVLAEYASAWSEAEQRQLFSETAMAAYRLRHLPKEKDEVS